MPSISSITSIKKISIDGDIPEQYLKNRIHTYTMNEYELKKKSVNVKRDTGTERRPEKEREKEWEM